MLFPDDALFEYVLVDLGEAIAAHPAPPIRPLPCDRYVARSCLQKAIRRAEPALAQQALANLFEYDRRAAWRALAIICLEDVGVANPDLLAQVVAAQRNRKWREQAGGDWRVLAELTRQMALSEHCQAACDLLLRATNDPALNHHRAAALEHAPAELAPMLWNANVALEVRSTAALAMGGGLAEGQRHHDPCAVFDILSDAGRSNHVVATCRAAWKLTRNPMALLLPLVWEQWMVFDRHDTTDDLLLPVQMLGGVPGYALDQFTRIGNAISRALLRADPELRLWLDRAGVRPGVQPRAVGDLLFLIEGGLVRRHTRWAVGDELRLPWRCLGTTTTMRDYVQAGCELLRRRASQLSQVRVANFHPVG
jgi:hypothetical protein